MHIPKNTALLGVIILLAASTSLRAETISVKDCLVNLIDEAGVAAQESGILTEVFAKDGQQVEANMPLAKIDDRLAVLQKNVARAELDVAEKEAKNVISVEYADATAKIAHNEVLRLYKAREKVPTSVSDSELDEARLALEEGKTYVKKALFDLQVKEYEVKVKKASLEAAEEHIKRRTVIAPWAGVVAKLVRHQGDWVEPGNPILHLVRMDKLRVSSFIDASLYNPSDVMGKPVRVTARLARNENVTFEGTVVGISPEVDSDNHYEVWAEVNNKKHNGYWILRPRMTADMEIQLNK